MTTFKMILTVLNFLLGSVFYFCTLNEKNKTILIGFVAMIFILLGNIVAIWN
mgnify:FL=1